MQIKSNLLKVEEGKKKGLSEGHKIPLKKFDIIVFFLIFPAFARFLSNGLHLAKLQSTRRDNGIGLLLTAS